MIKPLLALIAKLFLPLTTIRSKGDLDAFLAQFGWLSGANDAQSGSVGDLFALGGRIPDVEALAVRIGEGEEFTDEELIAGIELVVGLVGDISRLSFVSINAAPFTNANFQATFPTELRDFLLAKWLRANLPQLHGLLHLFGVIEYVNVAADAERFAFTRVVFSWQRLGDAFSDFPGLMRSVYKWDHAVDPLNFARLLDAVGSVANGFGVSTAVEPASPILAGIFYEAASAQRSTLLEARSRLVSYILVRPQATSSIGIDLVAVPIPPVGARTGDPVGIAIALSAAAAGEVTMQLAQQVTLGLSGSLGSEGALRLEIRPDDTRLVADPLAFVNPSLDAALSLVYSAPTPTVLLGELSATRLEFEQVGATFGITGQLADPEFDVELGVKRGRLVLVSSGGDGFIQKILPTNPITITFDFVFGLAKGRPFRLKGGVGLHFVVPIDGQVGPIFIKDLEIDAQAAAGELDITSAITVSASIGPLSAVIQLVGIITEIEFNKPGIFGNTDVNFRFKPPSGVGCAINTQGLRGGGFLSIDPPNYAGILNVAYQDTFNITIIGLVTTRLPGNRRGFSMVLSILARFQPIQLGMGIALEGVGGLIGIHRSLNEPGLRRVFLEHRLDAVLFPDDPIRDSAIILDAIATIFPATEGYHTFALFALLSWGASAKLVEARLGIAIEIGGPLRMALMGNIRSELPNAESPLLVLRMDILGFMDTGRQILSIDSTIYNSTLLQEFELSGDSAVRVDWSDESSDALFSVGGFFPGYKPTMPVPKLNRMSISLDSDIGKMSATSYFAVCSNSIQSGAALRIDCAWGSVSIRGGSGYDVLVNYSPFSFDASCYAWVKVGYKGTNVASVDLRFSLTGPNPFHAKGYAEVELFLLSFDVDFEARFGHKKPDEIPVVSPFADLLAQVRDPRSLKMELPPMQMRDVVFEPSTQEENLLDPGGAIVFSQRAMPLEFLLEKYGGGKPPKEESYLSVRFVGEDARVDTVRAKFAPGPYKNWSDKQKLSAPPFQMLPSGRRWTAAPAAPSAMAVQVREFETLLREEGSSDFVNFEPVEPEDEVRKGVALGGGRLRFTKDIAVKNPAHRNYVAVSGPQFTLVRQDSTADGAFARAVVGAAPAGNMSYTEAQDTAVIGEHADVVIMDVAFAQAV